MDDNPLYADLAVWDKRAWKLHEAGGALSSDASCYAALDPDGKPMRENWDRPGKWVTGETGESCYDACLTVGKVCTEEGLHLHNEELDTQAEFEMALGINCGEYLPRWGEATDVPNYIPMTGVCYGSKHGRKLDTFDCKRKLVGRNRLCYCEQPVHCDVRSGLGKSTTYPCECVPPLSHGTLKNIGGSGGDQEENWVEVPWDERIPQEGGTLQSLGASGISSPETADWIPGATVCGSTQMCVSQEYSVRQILGVPVPFMIEGGHGERCMDAPQWRLGKSGESCDEACGEEEVRGDWRRKARSPHTRDAPYELRCSQQEFWLHNSEIDSVDKLVGIYNKITGQAANVNTCQDFKDGASEPFVCAGREASHSHVGKTSDCFCKGTVYYGRKFSSQGVFTSFDELKSSAYKTRYVDNTTIACNNEEMGGDPLVKEKKYCYCEPDATKAESHTTYIGTNYGDSPDVPNVAGGHTGNNDWTRAGANFEHLTGCWASKKGRAKETFDCAAKLPGRSRLCYCSSLHKPDKLVHDSRGDSVSVNRVSTHQTKYKETRHKTSTGQATPSTQRQACTSCRMDATQLLWTAHGRQHITSTMKRGPMGTAWRWIPRVLGKWCAALRHIGRPP